MEMMSLTFVILWNDTI